MLMCWCIGQAASRIQEFYMLPAGRKMRMYDRLAVCTIVADSKGGVSSCDIPFSGDIQQFNSDYLRLTRQVAASHFFRPVQDFWGLDSSKSRKCVYLPM